MTGIIRYFTLSPLPESDRPEKKVVKFPLTPTGSGSLIRRREQNESNENSASQLLFQASGTCVDRSPSAVPWLCLRIRSREQNE